MLHNRIIYFVVTGNSSFDSLYNFHAAIFCSEPYDKATVSINRRVLIQHNQPSKYAAAETFISSRIRQAARSVGGNCLLSCLLDVFIPPGDGGRTLLQNAVMLVPDYTSSHSRT
jgi:hypothetical protein